MTPSQLANRQHKGRAPPSTPSPIPCARNLHTACLLLLLLVACPSATAQRRSAFQVLKSLNLGTFANSALSFANIKDPNWSGTLLAPTDAAFKALADEHNIYWSQIRGSSIYNKIMNYHIIAGQQLSSGRLSHAYSVSTRSGPLVIDRLANPSAVVFRGFESAATASKVDLTAGNTIIHVIGTILYPNFNPIPGCMSVMDIAKAEKCVDFVRLASFADYATNLDNNKWQGTAFIPTNAALTLKNSISKSTARRMTQSHFLGGPPQTFSWIISGQRITTAAGTTYTASRSGAKGRITLRGRGQTVTIIKSITACNAAVHLIGATLG